MENSTKKPILFKEKGLILILQKRKLIPSGGNTAYFFGRDESLYEVYRQGVWQLNDSFFYPFSGKECELSGEIDHAGKIQVHELKIIGEGYLMGKNEHLLPKNFLAIEGLPAISLTEAISFQIVKNQSSPFDSEATRLFMAISIGEEFVINIRVSMQMLELFFYGRITLPELVRLREDDLIYVDNPIIGNEIKEAVTYSKLEGRLDSLGWNNLYFGASGNETKESMLEKLKSLTRNGIIGIYKEIY